MASVEQLEFFRSIYEREQSRFTELIGRGKLYLSIVSLYFGAIALAVDKTLDVVKTSPLAAAGYLVGVLILTVSMGLILSAIGVYRYAYPNDPQAIICKGQLKLLSIEEFREERLFEYAAAAHSDHRVNDKRARLLKYASFALMGAVVAHSCTVLFVVWTVG